MKANLMMEQRFAEAVAPKRRILLLGEDAFAGLEVQALLNQEFRDIVLVRDSAAAILALTSSRFDLVIVDIVLAGMDGITLIKRLRGLALSLPIIGVVGIKCAEPTAPSLDFLDLALEAGATCCLRRPFASSQFLEAVKSTLVGSNSDGAVKSPQALPVEASDRPIGVLGKAIVLHELKSALGVLRSYVEEISQCSESNHDILNAMHDLMASIRVPEGRPKNGPYGNVRTQAVGVIALSHNTRAQQSPSQNLLTPREREVLGLVTEGVSNKMGAFRLSISVRTFEAHRANLMAKLRVKNAAELVRFGLERAI